MKNIIILGVPRSGKTTLSKMILKKYPEYNFIQEDIINETLRKIIESNSNKRGWAASFESTNLLYDNMANFLDTAKMFEPDLKLLLDTVSLTPKTCKKYQQHGNIVIIMGYPNETVKNVLMRIRLHETKKDWTTINTDSTMNMYISHWLAESKRLEKEAKHLCLKFVDTGKNREKVLNETMEWLDNKLNKTLSS